ncbi:NAD(+)--rifampin ADP-ribosyltransferase [Chryseobacterium phocaeense]|uniref:NAD(+)--rifampin ADP-ribosyltransferase n=1 Tax=Chryseobacterium phocaeense TaxID=1816690 RepID=UPI0009B9B874|nr:NAD(+)--rifampin ADP-ribosyltransferase [Chryseobacterium phocaeense]
MEHIENKLVPENPKHNPFAQTFFHGTKADLKIGDHIYPGHQCNYMENRKLNHVYVASTLTAAIWGAELALGDAQQRIYLVEATGEIENDPNVTDKKMPGNPTMSYRSSKPFKVIGELGTWQPHSAEEIQAMQDGLRRLKEQGHNLIID